MLCVKDVNPAHKAGFLFLSYGVDSTKGGCMKKIMILGKLGNGKSTLSRRLAFATQLPLHALDMIEYKKMARGSNRLHTVKYMKISLQKSFGLSKVLA